MKRTALLLAALGLLSAGSAVQAMPGTAPACPASGHPHGGMHGMSSAHAHQNLSPMHQELIASMSRMHAAMHDGMTYLDADAVFASGMIPHHHGAIEMAQIELKYGKDPEMRKLAQSIIDAQGPEIARMNEWRMKNPDALKVRGKSHADMKPFHMALMAGMDAMHKDMMRGMMSNDPDAVFAASMAAHHAGAIEMAKVELQFGKDAGMKALAQEIIDAQRPEIEQMRAWLDAHADKAQAQKL